MNVVPMIGKKDQRKQERERGRARQRDEETLMTRDFCFKILLYEILLLLLGRPITIAVGPTIYENLPDL